MLPTVLLQTFKTAFLLVTIGLYSFIRFSLDIQQVGRERAGSWLEEESCKQKQPKSERVQPVDAMYMPTVVLL